MNMIARRTRSGRKGYIIIIAVFIMFLSSVMAAAVTHAITRGYKLAESKFYKMQAFYQAQHGVYEVIYDYMATPSEPYTHSYSYQDATTKIEAGTRDADLFLVSTARVQLTGASAPFTLSGVGIANLTDNDTKSLTSVDIEHFAYASGSLTAQTSYTGSIGQKVYIPNAITLTFNYKPETVVATFNFSDGSSRKAALYTFWTTEDRHAAFNDFVIKSTARVTVGGVEYRRTIVASYDVSFSRIVYLSESREHLF